MQAAWERVDINDAAEVCPLRASSPCSALRGASPRLCTPWLRTQSACCATEAAGPGLPPRQADGSSAQRRALRRSGGGAAAASGDGSSGAGFGGEG